MAAAGEAITHEQAMVGVLALLVAEREDRLSPKDGVGSERFRKTEVVLADAGLTSAQIGRILGKKANSVAKTISRARGKAADSEAVDA